VAVVTVDGTDVWEDELPAEQEEVSLADLTRDDLQEDDDAPRQEVRHPGHDEIITVTGLVGGTVELGFNPKTAKFFQIDGNLVAALPNGGLVVFEDYGTALYADAAPTLLFKGRPIGAGLGLDAYDVELDLAPAGEAGQPANIVMTGGTSAYDEDLDPATGQTAVSTVISSAASADDGGVGETTQDLSAGGDDPSFGGETLRAVSGETLVSVAAADPSADAKPGRRLGHDKGKKKGGGAGGDTNDAPTDVDLDDDTIAENSPSGEMVGMVSALDPNPGDGVTFELVDNAGGRFAIDPQTGALAVANGAALDHESADRHDIVVRVTDDGGAAYEEGFTLRVADVNEVPSDLDLTNVKVPADSASGSVVGRVDVSDPDEGDSFDFALSVDAGGRFAIDPKTGEITVADETLLDPETAASHDITVRVTDSGGASYYETFTLVLEPASPGEDNAAPSAIALDNRSVLEAAAGAVVGRMTVDDPDPADTHVFSVDDARFEVVGGELKLKDGISLDHEFADRIDITVSATDPGGLAASQDFEISVLDANEAPTAKDDSAATSEDAELVVGASGVLANDGDPDAGDTVTVTAFDGLSAKGAAVTANPDGSYTYDPSASPILQALAAGEVATDSFTYSISDAAGATDTATVNVTVTGADDGTPTPSGDTYEILGVWAGNYQKHLYFEDYLGKEIKYTSQKIGDFSWDHAKNVSLWLSEQFAPVSDRVTLSLIYNVLPKDGSTTFADVINGTYDADLRTIATNLINGGHGDAIFRLLHEADMPGRTWTFRDGNADDYIAAWRHVHEVMMSVPGAEFKWQYSLNGPAGSQAKENGVYLTELGYPGDDYVDSISISNYDRERYANDFEKVREKLEFIRDFAESHGKKMDLGEWGLWPASDNGGGDNPEFIKETLDWFQALPEELKGYLLYFDLHDSVDLEQYPNSEALFLELFGPDSGGPNDAPAEIFLDNLSVEEAAAGAVVGRLTVDDPDPADTHVFSVDDARFEVVGGELKLKDGISLNHESADRIDVTVSATDPGGLATSQVFQIVVLDVNEAPTDILFGTDVDENAPNGMLVRIAVAVDPDQGDSFTYELIDDADGRFTIDSARGEVTVANGAELDFENAAGHDITIQVTDSGGETYRETFTIHVNDVNEAPSDLDLDASSVPENSDDGSLVGTVSVADQDGGEVFTFELLDDAEGRFVIDRSSGQIRVANGHLIDYEAATSYGVTVRVTDSGGLFYDESFAITVEDVPDGGNAAPTAIELDNLSVAENAAGAVIGQLSVVDPDAGDSHSFTVDDARFEVVDGRLKLKDGVGLDFEQESQVSLNITATDDSGLDRTESFTLAVGDANDAPVAVDDVASVHFESTGGEPVDKLWEDDFSGDWTSRWPLRWVYTREGASTSTFELEGETWLRVTYPEGDVAKGFQFRTDEAPRDRMYLQYDVRFADDFEWVQGGKLPGLSGGEGATGGNPPDGENGWSVRFMWRADGKGSAYVYHPDQPKTYGEHFRLDNFWFQKGVQTIGLEVVMNTPGEHDGIIRAWLDGVLVVEVTTMRFRDIPDLQIDQISFDTFFGGNTDDWAPVKEEHIDFGDFKLYEAPPWEGGELINADPITLDLLDDDTDQDGDALSLSKLYQPSSGTAIDNGDGSVTYHPDETFSLYDSFAYAVTDGAGGESRGVARVLDDSLNHVLGTSADDSLNGTSGGDYVSGGDGDDTLSGQSGDDVLFGGAGSDYLNGGEGHDVLIGGAGADTIDVSLGTDLVIYENLLDGGDIIDGFNAAEGHDIISLDRLFDHLGVATAERANQTNVEKDGSIHTLSIDTTGDGLFDLMVATVNVVSGELLDVRQDDADVSYGSL